MAGSKEIRTKIKSIKNTQKITQAMRMISASKMRKALERMTTSQPYAEKMRKVIGHVAHSNSEYRHPYLQERKRTRVGLIVVSTDRGLCGGFNINLFKAITLQMKEWQQQSLQVDLCLLGRKSGLFFKRMGGNVLAAADHLGDKPNITDLIGIVKVMLHSYDEHEIDALYIAHNQFINTMIQKPVIKQLLPLEPNNNDDLLENHWDYIYEPDAKGLLDTLLTRYIETQVYQAVVENIAAEQAARMIAMQNATENAGQLINEFQLAYNKARQAAITQEIAEIVGGAAAVEG